MENDQFSKDGAAVLQLIAPFIVVAVAIVVLLLAFI